MDSPGSVCSSAAAPSTVGSNEPAQQLLQPSVPTSPSARTELGYPRSSSDGELELITTSGPSSNASHPSVQTYDDKHPQGDPASEANTTPRPPLLATTNGQIECREIPVQNCNETDLPSTAPTRAGTSAGKNTPLRSPATKIANTADRIPPAEPPNQVRGSTNQAQTNNATVGNNQGLPV